MLRVLRGVTTAVAVGATGYAVTTPLRQPALCEGASQRASWYSLGSWFSSSPTSSSSSATLAGVEPDLSKGASYHGKLISAIDGEARSVWRPPSREAQLKRLQNETFDLLVIGGGITGVGTALEAASRGLTVALVENGDFANGTSSRSTKLIHGGVRYLEQAFKTLDVSMLHLVREALRERGHMLTSAPHMNTPLPIIIPLHAYWEIPYMWVGVKLYEFFAGRDSQTPPSYFMSKEKVEKEFPLLKTDSMRGAIVYYDGQMNDARHTLEVALTGMQKGAALANYVGVTSLLKRYSPRPSSSSSSSSSSTSSPATDADDVAAGGGRVCGAKVVDRITGKEFDVTARMVVNATGAFGDAIRTMDDPKAAPLVVPSMGVHLVLSREFSGHTMGMLVPKTPDGRVLFCLPWEGNTIVGTTDAASPLTDLPRATEKEVNYIIDTMKDYIKRPIEASDVKGVWAGLRPLVKDPKAVARGDNSTKALSRQHVVTASPSGLVTVMGGKYTTYRQMAQDTVDEALKHVDKDSLSLAGTTSAKLANVSITFNMGLHGTDSTGKICGMNYKLLENFIRSRRPHLEDGVVKHLVKNYGVNALQVLNYSDKWESGKCTPLAKGHPYLEAEVVYAADEEAAQCVEDVLCRRTRLAFVDSEAAITSVPRVVELLGARLKWSKERKEAERKRAVEVLASMDMKSISTVKAA